MKVLLTGATGFVGSEVLRQLLSRGHEVRAVVRSPSAADQIRSAGAEPILGSLVNPAFVSTVAHGVDGIVHTAAPAIPGPGLDRVVVPAVLDAIRVTPIRYVHSSGAWVLGSGSYLNERSRPEPPTITAWRVPLEKQLRSSGTNTTIIAPGLVHDDYGRGLTRLLCPAPGLGRLIGDGQQRWSTVHVRDLAALYVLALEAPTYHALLLGVAGCPTVEELARSAVVDGQIEQEPVERSRVRLGADLVDALLLDQSVDSSETRDIVGWRPVAPTATQVLAAAAAAAMKSRRRREEMHR